MNSLEKQLKEKSPVTEQIMRNIDGEMDDISFAIERAVYKNEKEFDPLELEYATEEDGIFNDSDDDIDFILDGGLNINAIESDMDFLSFEDEASEAERMINMLGFDDEALESPTLKSGPGEPNDSLNYEISDPIDEDSEILDEELDEDLGEDEDDLDFTFEGQDFEKVMEGVGLINDDKDEEFIKFGEVDHEENSLLFGFADDDL
jgi:hypothetical protein